MAAERGERSMSVTQPNLAPLAVDRREAARLLGVSAGTVDNLRQRGELRSFKVGARRLYRVVDLENFMRKRLEAQNG